ncbi:MAG: DUF4253 domain-containing protein [Planctomycetota bacterium]
METFLVRFPLPMDRDQASGRASLASLLTLDDEGVVVSAWSSLVRDAVELALLVEASDSDQASRAAHDLIERADLPTAPDQLQLDSYEPEPVGRLVFGSDLDDVLEALGQTAQGIEHRPPVELPAEIAADLGPELLGRLGAPDAIGARVRLGRVWTRQEDCPTGCVPWRSYDGADVGLPVTTRLATLAGIAFEADAEGVEILHDVLRAALHHHRWSAFTLGDSVEEWFGRAGFRTYLRAPSGRLVLGLFPVANPSDLIWFHGTTGLGAGVGTEELAFRLGSWDERYGALPIEVGPTRVCLRIARPRDVDALCAEAVGLCPAAHAHPRGARIDLEHGHAKFHEIARMLERTGRLTLDWS